MNEPILRVGLMIQVPESVFLLEGPYTLDIDDHPPIPVEVGTILTARAGPTPSTRASRPGPAGRIATPRCYPVGAVRGSCRP